MSDEHSGEPEPPLGPSAADVEASSRRRRWASRHRSGETPEQRMERFMALQQHVFDLLQSSPDGYAHFLKRNYRLRRSELIDGSWQPVETDRHPPLP